MKFNPISSRAHMAKVLLVLFLSDFGRVAGAQIVVQPGGVERAPIASQALPGDPGCSLTAVVVILAPGAAVASHHHPGIVCAYVLEGTVRSQLNGGDAIEYRAGQSWIEPPGSEHTLTLNPSRTLPTSLLAVFIAPTGAQLTPYDP